MIQHRIFIHAKFSPEILERILRVVRHRGFRVYFIHMIPIVDLYNIHIELNVISKRPINLLLSQLYKLLDVKNINVRELKINNINN